MPYKDNVKQKKSQSNYYQNNKDLYRQKFAQRRKDLKSWFDELRSKYNCLNCGEKRVYCLDFHHVDPKDKHNTVSILVNECRSKDQILKEIHKCIALCANCHRELHYYKNEL